MLLLEKSADIGDIKAELWHLYFDHVFVSFRLTFPRHLYEKKNKSPCMWAGQPSPDVKQQSYDDFVAVIHFDFAKSA